MERRSYIDWLRVLAMLAVLVFHCARFFDPLPWHLKNPETSQAALIFVGFLDGWLMQLFFLLSGFGAWWALARRTPLAFVKERFLRLQLPLYTVGLFLLLPPQRYWDHLTAGDPMPGGFLAFYPQFLTQFGFNPTSPFFLSPWSGHLWFLRFLFVISLALLPLLWWLRSPGGQGALDRLMGWLDRRGGVWLVLVPLVGLRLVWRPHSGDHDWDAMVNYGAYFLLGCLLAARPRLGELARVNLWTSLVLGLAAFGSLGVLIMSGAYQPWAHGQRPALIILGNALGALNTWSWLVFILALGQRWLERPGNWLAWANEAVLPAYILHQTVILAMGWWLGPLDWGIGPKFLALVGLALGATLLLYVALVRPWPPVRFCFGMKPARSGA